MSSKTPVITGKKNGIENISFADFDMEAETKEALQLIHKQAKENPVPLTNQEKFKVQTFLENSFPDKGLKLNKKLDQLKDFDSADSEIGSFVISIIKDLTFRTRNLKLIEPHIDTLIASYQPVIDDPQKKYTGPILTLEGYGMLYDLAKLNQSLEQLDKMGLLQNNPKLAQLLENTRKAKQLISYQDQSFNQKFKFPTGALVVEHIESKCKVIQNKVTVGNEIVSKVTKYGHTGTGISVQRPEEKIHQISHINPSYQEDPFKFRDYLYCEVYAIDLEHLISPENKAYLKRNLGENWLEEVKAVYYAIERETHDKASMMHYHVTANPNYTDYANIAINKIAGHSSVLEAGHNPVDIAHEVYGAEKWHKDVKRTQSRMLCSEFTAKTMVASIQQLNGRNGALVALLKSKNVTEPCPDPLIRNPLSQQLKLTNLDPESLVKELKKQKAIKRVAAVGQEFVESRTSIKEQKKSIKERLGDAVGMSKTTNIETSTTPITTFNK